MNSFKKRQQNRRVEVVILEEGASPESIKR